MANYKTGAQRYNDRMDKIFERAKKDWPTSGLHGPSKEDVKSHEKKEKIAKKMKKSVWDKPAGIHEVKERKEWSKK